MYFVFSQHRCQNLDLRRRNFSNNWPYKMVNLRSLGCLNTYAALGYSILRHSPVSRLFLSDDITVGNNWIHFTSFPRRFRCTYTKERIILSPTHDFSTVVTPQITLCNHVLTYIQQIKSPKDTYKTWINFHSFILHSSKYTFHIES